MRPDRGRVDRVSRDDPGDYATNAHVIDGPANLADLLATFDPAARTEAPSRRR